MLAQMDKNLGGRLKSTASSMVAVENKPPTLTSLGINKKESFNWNEEVL